MIDQSRQFIQELNDLAKQYGVVTDTRSTIKGKIFRTWMELKAAFGADQPDDILPYCEHNERAALKAYECALEEEELDHTFRDLILMQRRMLKESEEKIGMMSKAK